MENERKLNAALKRIWSETHGHELREYLRKHLNEKTVRALAATLRTSDGYLSQIMTGKSALTDVILSRIAEATGKSKEHVLQELGIIKALKEIDAGNESGIAFSHLGEEEFVQFFHHKVTEWENTWGEKETKQAFAKFIENLCVFLLASKKLDLFTVEALLQVLKRPEDVRRYLLKAAQDTKQILFHALSYTMYPFEYAQKNLSIRELSFRSLPETFHIVVEKHAHIYSQSE